VTLCRLRYAPFGAKYTAYFPRGDTAPVGMDEKAVEGSKASQYVPAARLIPTFGKPRHAVSDAWTMS